MRKDLTQGCITFPCVYSGLSGTTLLLRGLLYSRFKRRNFLEFTVMRGKSVLLIIGGGIAAYKALELIRRLAERGVKSRAILTRAGAEFVTPLSMSALTGEKVYSDLFSLTDESEMGHIELSRSADLVVRARATADLMGKLAAGLANDLASTALLATDKKILLAPAMNVRMWQAASTQRNFETLKRDGVLFVGPD